MGTQKNHLNEMILLSMFMLMEKKIMQFFPLKKFANLVLYILIIFHLFQYMVKCGKNDSPEEGTKAEVS